MILIADSGSTKTDWRLIDHSGEISQMKSDGMNPYYQDSEAMYQGLSGSIAPNITGPVDFIYFYGAGCITQADKQLVAAALNRVFEKAKIEVHDDLLAAARALCGIDPGIACILGTGSNSCLYDGQKIVDRIPPLGFILGDEGSGGYIGKRLVSDYLKRMMPDDIKESFVKRFDPNRDQIIESVYKKEFPNRYLASYSRFALHHLDHPYVYDLVFTGFTHFFERNIKRYADGEKYPVHFVGSVAFYYSNILRQVANDSGMVVKNILESPIAGLTLFHQQTAG